MLHWTVEQALELDGTDSSLAAVAPALLVQNCQYPGLNFGVDVDTVSARGLFRNLPAQGGVRLVAHIVRGLLFRMARHVMCFDDKIKEGVVAGLRIIGMAGGRQIPERPVDC